MLCVDGSMSREAMSPLSTAHRTIANKVGELRNAQSIPHNLARDLRGDGPASPAHRTIGRFEK